jgi:hypothetical protein
MPWRVDCPPGNPRALSLGSWHLHNVHADLAHAPCEELNLIPWPTESEPDLWHALSSNNGYIYADELKTFKDNLAKERETPCTPQSWKSKQSACKVAALRNLHADAKNHKEVLCHTPSTASAVKPPNAASAHM